MNQIWIDALTNTAGLTLGTAVLATCVALPLAWLIERTDLPGRHSLGRWATLPYAIPSFLLAMAWITLANPNSGWINTVVRQWFPGATVIDLYTFGGLIAVETSCLFSILYLNFATGLRQLDPSFEEAARLSGASRFTVFRRITFPLLRGMYGAGLLAVALAAMASFGVPAMIGTPARRFVVTTEIFTLIREGEPEAFRFALKIAGLLSLTALGLAWLLSVFERRMAPARAAKPVTSSSRIALGGWRWPAALGAWGFLALALGLPAVTLALASLRVSSASNEFTLRAWRYVLFSLPDFWPAVRVSLVSSLAASTVAVGTALILVPRTLGRRLGGVLETATLVTYSLPGTALALLLVIGLTWVPGGRFIADGVGVLVLAFVLKYSQLAWRTLRANARSIDPTLIEAARLAGANRFTVWWHIWCPLLAPAARAAFALTLIPCVAELTMCVVLFGPGTQNLGVLLFQLHDYADRAAAAVIGTLALGSVFLLQIALQRLQKDSSA